MAETTLQHFQLLKTRLQTTLQASYPHLTRNIHEWTAQEITTLQEALHQSVKGYISEKWFYTHLKPLENQKLPRIDMLDMLAQYVGYAGWQDFMFQTSLPAEAQPILPTSLPTAPQTKLIYPKAFLFAGLACVLILFSFLVGKFSFLPAHKIEFCFQDADTQKTIAKDIEVYVLKSKESPQLQKINKQGCIILPPQTGKITFVIKAPYYKTDTITRQLTQGQASEVIRLKKDDYALLIYLIAKHGTTQEEKQQRMKQLDRIFDDEAQIFQIDESGLGIELYSKEDFVNKLSLPVSSLQNIQIIETQYEAGKIMLLRFLQK